MPPAQKPFPPDHLLPPHKKSWGPLIGIVIIICLMILGVLYVVAKQREHAAADQLPFIIGDTPESH